MVPDPRTVGATRKPEWPPRESLTEGEPDRPPGEGNTTVYRERHGTLGGVERATESLSSPATKVNNAFHSACNVTKVEYVQRLHNKSMPARMNLLQNMRQKVHTRRTLTHLMLDALIQTQHNLTTSSSSTTPAGGAGDRHGVVLSKIKSCHRTRTVQDRREGTAWGSTVYSDGTQPTTSPSPYASRKISTRATVKKARMSLYDNTNL